MERLRVITHEGPMATGLVKWWRARFLAGYKPFSGNTTFNKLIRLIIMNGESGGRGGGGLENF